MATRPLLSELLADYRRLRQVTVRMESVGGVDAARRVAAGDPFDVVVLARPALDKLAAAGHVIASSGVDIARSSIAMAVRAGARVPPLRNADDVRRAVASAASIGYSTGPSGDHLLVLLRAWGLEGRAAPRLVRAAPGVPVGSLVASGEADVAFQQFGELRNVAGIEVAGLLPDEVQSVTVFSGAATRLTPYPREVSDLLAFLASPATADAKRRHGLEP